MKTIETLNKGNRNARIMLTESGNYEAIKMINIDQVTGSKAFKTLKGAMLFANNHING